MNMPIGPVVASRERPSGMYGGRARGGMAREIVLRKERPAYWAAGDGVTHRLRNAAEGPLGQAAAC